METNYEHNMTRLEFIKSIFSFFRNDDQNLMRTYDIALSVKYAVDWNKLFHEVITTCEKRVLPMPKYFAEKLPQFKKISAAYSADEGCTVRVFYDTTSSKDDKEGIARAPYYDFVISNIEGCPTLNDIKKHAERVDENGVKHTIIKKIVKYPKQVTLIGEQVFFNTKVSDKLPPDEQMKQTILQERELKSQIKVLFQREE